MDKEDKLQAILDDLAEVKAWKKRQEQDQADRLTELRNNVIQVFLDYGATISEVLTVLKLIEVDTSSLFIRGQKSKALGQYKRRG